MLHAPKSYQEAVTGLSLEVDLQGIQLTHQGAAREEGALEIVEVTSR
jgi:hypothetical protein